MVVVSNKTEEDIIVTPEFFRNSFQDIGVSNGASIVLHEFKNIRDDYSDVDEEGEAEHEEMEAEQEEENNDEQPAEEEEEKPEEDQNQPPKTASEVLFDNEGDSKTAKTNN